MSTATSLQPGRRVLYLGIAGVLLCLSALWFTRTYAIVKQRTWVGMSGEARADHLLAARQLLVRLGARVQESGDIAQLAQFPASGRVLMADRDRLDPVAIRTLRDWVRRGGHLIVAAEPPFARDSFLEQLGVTSTADGVGGPDAVDEVDLPNGAHLRISLPRTPVLHDVGGHASWQHTTRGDTRMLQLADGAGRITILSTLVPFTNQAIGRLDHAELLWQLVRSDDGAPIDVWLVRQLKLQSLPQWLVQHALPAIAVFAILLILALWRAMPRFGPLQPEVALDRRSLREHFTAMGRFYSAQRQLPKLLHALRRDALELMRRRMPAAGDEQGSDRIAAAAQAAGMSMREVQHAFGVPADAPRDFVGAVRVLAELRARLASRSLLRAPGAERAIAQATDGDAGVVAEARP